MNEHPLTTEEEQVQDILATFMMSIESWQADVEGTPSPKEHDGLAMIYHLTYVGLKNVLSTKGVVQNEPLHAKGEIMSEQQLKAAINQLHSLWESEVTGTPIHWEKTDERKEIDAGYTDQLMQLIDQYAYEYAERVIGDGELHISHVCPQDSISCREFGARGRLRNAQHQRNKELSPHRATKDEETV